MCQESGCSNNKKNILPSHGTESTVKLWRSKLGTPGFMDVHPRIYGFVLTNIINDGFWGTQVIIRLTHMVVRKVLIYSSPRSHKTLRYVLP